MPTYFFLFQHSKAFSGLDLADHSDGEDSLQVDMLIAGLSQRNQEWDSSGSD